MARPKIGVIGAGYWGPNLVRTFLEIPDVALRAVADRDPARLEHIQSRHPHIEYLTLDHRRLFEIGLDAVVVATPPETHYGLVRECLERGLDVLVEKPLATTTEQALELAALAEANDRILMVGHIGAYNPAVGALKEMIDGGELGEIRYVDAVRVGLGLFHPALNVVWDLGPHDVSILLHLLGESPVNVSTRGVSCVQSSIEDVAYMTLMFPSGVLAHTRMSWLDPCKTRRITVVGSRKMVVYDDLESHEKLKVYDKSVNAIRETDTFGEYQFSYHYGSVVSPYIHFEEPLRVECQHFLECVIGRKQPLTGPHNGVEVVRIIEAAQRSLRDGGSQVWIGEQALLPMLAHPAWADGMMNGAPPAAAAPIGSMRPPDDQLAAELLAPSRNGHTGSGNGRPDVSGNGQRDVLIDLTEPSTDGHERRAAEGR